MSKICFIVRLSKIATNGKRLCEGGAFTPKISISSKATQQIPDLLIIGKDTLQIFYFVPKEGTRIPIFFIKFIKSFIHLVKSFFLIKCCTTEKVLAKCGLDLTESSI